MPPLPTLGIRREAKKRAGAAAPIQRSQQSAGQSQATGQRTAGPWEPLDSWHLDVRILEKRKVQSKMPNV